MPARCFKLITSDNNIVNPAQTAEHLGVIPGSKFSYKVLTAAAKAFCKFCAQTLVKLEYLLPGDTELLVWNSNPEGLKSRNFPVVVLSNSFAVLYHIQAGVAYKSKNGMPPYLQTKPWISPS